ncbi:PREDICTED: NADH dehydrogenase [ubiquinone] 1 beta subcomplex subunit 2, mitochondrial-like isoform X2 [Wasmannia auropunctata]|uniref:NADH dehydrogenase [ubiquinone] 1 beta subcomplex subunit 2, mitochondrial-like isoform X2 n=1 Tax=Wasmannia auropunctata TaxID=64793 RepID=UPI0005EF7931|nr:PREDICTED: NADH dehydrogenase [ubiquinone] 1 beta subcomplex subunit 2, mitochondrial-like isoform X2 [Wasmannia auropunctata]
MFRYSMQVYIYFIIAQKYFTCSVRLSHGVHVYRDIPPEDKKWVYTAEFFGGIMWWWVLWHFWHDFGHIVGEFPYPDPSMWTDKELGIPPDDYEPESHVS